MTALVSAFPASALAEHVKGTLRGDGSVEVRGAASLEGAGPGDVVFAVGESQLAKALSGPAACVITRPEFETGERTAIVVDDPRLAFARVLRRLYPEAEPVPGVHPTAVIADDAKLGDDVSIGPYVVIEAGARVGARTAIAAGSFVGQEASVGSDCVLHPRVTLYARVRVGDRAILHSGAVIGADGFGFATDSSDGGHEKFPQVGTVELGDEVEVGANTTIDRGALDATVIGAGTKIDNLVQLGHNVRVGRRAIICAQAGVAGSAEIGDAVVLAGQAGVANKVRIEPGVVVGAQAGISNGKRVRSGSVVMGSPMRPIRDYMQVQAHLSRLPELARRVRALERREGADEG